MVTIFHLSDLHIESGAFWNNLKECYLDKARELGAAKKEGEKLLILTGDFHNYWEDSYKLATEFLNELIGALGIEREKDVFLIPGNHDVGNDTVLGAGKDKRDKSAAWLKEHNTAGYDDGRRGYRDYVEDRLEAFTPYCEFARALGVYPKDSEAYLPARVHVRCWRDRLNILHLNTALAATGDPVRAEQMDILTATNGTIWNNVDRSKPALALGHNNFYDLVEDKDKWQMHRASLTPELKRRGVCAYLCGDVHAEEYDPNHKWIALDANEDYYSDKIRNAVGVKGAVSERDYENGKKGKRFDIGFYLHEWDEKTGKVSMTLMRWDPQWSQGDFRSFKEGYYFIPRPNPSSGTPPTMPDSDPRPPETPREERARALALAGRSDEALTILQKKSGFFAKVLNKLTEWGIISPQPLTIVQIASNAGDEEDAEQARKRGIRQHINEVLLRIDMLKSKGINRETIPEIRACYEECVNLAKAHRVSVYVLYDYANFLWRQHEYTPAIEAARWLLDYYKQEHEPEDRLAALENLLGIIYAESKRFKEAEDHYRAALGLYRKLAAANPAAYKPDVAMTCNNLGNLLAESKRFKKAEEYYRAALAIYRKLAAANPAAYEPHVAGICNNLGALFAESNHFEKAEAQFREALAIRRKLAAANPAAYEPHLAKTCFNYGLLLRKDAARKAEAKPLFEEAARLWDKYPHYADLAQRSRNILNEFFGPEIRPWG